MTALSQDKGGWLCVSARLEVVIDQGWLDHAPLAGDSMNRKGCRWVALWAKVMGHCTLGDVRTWVYGHIFVIRDGTV